MALKSLKRFIVLFLALAFGLSSCKARPKYIRDVIEPSKPRPPSPQENSEVNIKPVVIDAQSQPNLNIGQSFFIKEGRLFDKTSHEFIMRGINNPHNYWKEKAFNVLPLLQNSKFNTVRIVWCADTLIRTGRCEPKDVFPIEELVRILQELRARAMVGVLNLQNATGSDSSADLQAMVEYLLKPEVKQVLLEYQDMLLLNIANEWYGTMDSPGSNFNGANYKSGLSKAIKSLRAGGLPHVLILDAQGWGQYFESIPRDAKELLKLDQNLLFSAHFYDLYADPNKVSQAFASVRQNQIPFIVGEFACEHQPGQSVACSAIMEEASRPDSAFGYIAWSTSGNGGDLSQLNVFQDDGQQWQNLSDWGRILLDGPHGIKATSQPACLFTQSEDAASCGRIKNLP